MVFKKSPVINFELKKEKVSTTTRRFESDQGREC